MIGYSILRDSISVTVVVHDALLPFAKAVEGLPRMVVDLQGRLEKVERDVKLFYTQ